MITVILNYFLQSVVFSQIGNLKMKLKAMNYKHFNPSLPAGWSGDGGQGVENASLPAVQQAD